MTASEALSAVLPMLVGAIESGALSLEAQDQVIEMAFQYAVDNNLPYDGTLKGAVKLAEEARRTVGDFLSKQQALARATGRHERNVVGEGYEQERPN
jgi:hypothetical protein